MIRDQDEVDGAVQPAVAEPDTDAVREWLVAYVANLLEFERSEVKTSIPFSRYGIDSTTATALTGDLGSWIGCNIDPRLLYEHKTIDALSSFIAANYTQLRTPEK
jgi:acyl carrier protein